VPSGAVPPPLLLLLLLLLQKVCDGGASCSCARQMPYVWISIHSSSSPPSVFALTIRLAAAAADADAASTAAAAATSIAAVVTFLNTPFQHHNTWLQGAGAGSCHHCLGAAESAGLHALVPGPVDQHSGGVGGGEVQVAVGVVQEGKRQHGVLCCHAASKISMLPPCTSMLPCYLHGVPCCRAARRPPISFACSLPWPLEQGMRLCGL